MNSHENKVAWLVFISERVSLFLDAIWIDD